jgi:hypothetical protein
MSSRRFSAKESKEMGQRMLEEVRSDFIRWIFKAIAIPEYLFAKGMIQ